ncbi:WGR domain-containing protein [uncultured Flavobacterium sp.]|uniref:WGR domain-containing protein n=1 Tax=uncultured Flavobacterium sp. TaxID=165435 RepID=UPI0025E1C88E|nr:WGR domain-containing protein [uncultured Flavobacterium sp.]
MATLYTITIKTIADTKVTAEIRVDHPDAGSDIGSKDFALQILLETGHIERPYFEKLPIPETEWRRLVTEHPRKEEYDLMHIYNDGDRIEITAEEGIKRGDWGYFEESNKEFEAQYGRKVVSSGLSDGKYYIRFDNEPLKVIEAANKVIRSKPVKRKLEKDLYTLEFEVADAEYLYHLREKMRYESAAYNLLSCHRYEVRTEEGETVLLAYKDAKSDKFWQVVQHGDTLEISYGKTGTDGQKNVKAFDSAQKAERERDKLIAEKLGKGYARAN